MWRDVQRTSTVSREARCPQPQDLRRGRPTYKKQSPEANTNWNCQPSFPRSQQVSVGTGPLPSPLPSPWSGPHAAVWGPSTSLALSHWPAGDGQGGPAGWCPETQGSLGTLSSLAGVGMSSTEGLHPPGGDGPVGAGEASAPCAARPHAVGGAWCESKPTTLCPELRFDRGLPANSRRGNRSQGVARSRPEYSGHKQTTLRPENQENHSWSERRINRCRQ